MTDNSELVAAGLAFLVEHPEPITYSDFNAALGNPFDMTRDEGRHAIGRLLGDITAAHRAADPVAHSGLMLSALVHARDGGPGVGFYHLAADLNLVRRDLPSFEQFEFWVNQVTAIRKRHGAA